MLNRRDFGLSTLASGLALTIRSPARAQVVELGRENLPELGTISADTTSLSDAPITVKDSPLQNALDVYYDFLLGIVKQKGMSPDQKLLLNSTIIPFDISQDTPYFNDGLFRNFADRVFYGSPQAIGPANRADRFSKHYEDVIHIAASNIDRDHSDILDEVKDLNDQIKKDTKDLAKTIADINAQWAIAAKGLGIKPTDPTYELKYIGFLESVDYADQVGIYTKSIDQAVSDIDAARRKVYTPSQQLILDNIVNLSDTKKVARPLRPTFERSAKFPIDDLTFANPTNRVGGAMDISPAAYPLGDLVKFLKLDGLKQQPISNNSTVTDRHDQQWGVGGSASVSFFGVGISVGGNASGSSSYKTTIAHTNELDISFANIAEYFVDREAWYNPAVFQDKDLTKILSRISGANNLQYVSVSLLVARGLKVTLKFDTSIDVNNWSKQQFEANGGVSILGFPFGGSVEGSSASQNWHTEVSGDHKGITFVDDPQLARVVGFRVEPFFMTKKPRMQLLAADERAELTTADLRLVDKLKTGQISYTEYQKQKFPPESP